MRYQKMCAGGGQETVILQGMALLFLFVFYVGLCQIGLYVTPVAPYSLDS